MKRSSELINEHVITTCEATFEKDVINASYERPVLVDFWAEWCGPCSSIAPILDELASELDGDLIVAKVDTDAEQGLAQTYGIRSLPTMMVFRDGKPAEQIIGAQPGSEIRRVVEQYLPDSGTDLVGAAAQALAAGDLDTAEAQLREALTDDPKNYSVHPLLAMVLLQRGEIKNVENMIAELPINIVSDSAFDPIKAQLHLISQVEGDSDRDALEKLADDIENVEARYQRSVLQAIERDFETALNTLLELIIVHRAWNDGAIHEVILDIFNVMDRDDPRLKGFRTRLSRTLN